MDKQKDQFCKIVEFCVKDLHQMKEYHLADKKIEGIPSNLIRLHNSENQI